MSERAKINGALLFQIDHINNMKACTGQVKITGNKLNGNSESVAVAAAFDARSGNL